MTEEIKVELDLEEDGEINDASKPEFEAVLTPPLEALCGELVSELSKIYGIELYFIKVEEEHSVAAYSGKGFFSRKKFYFPLIKLKENVTDRRKEIVAEVYGEAEETALRRHREQYLRYNPDVSFFRILRSPKTFRTRKVGFS